MNIQQNKNLDSLSIHDYFNPTKDFKAYLWTSAYGLANILYLYSNNMYEKKFVLQYIDTVHKQLGTHSVTKKNLSKHIKPYLKWVKLLKPAKQSSKSKNTKKTRSKLRNSSELDLIKSKKDLLFGTLRIGKAEQNLQEGVYTHYLTKWVHVLLRSAILLKEPLLYCQACHIMFTTCEVIIKDFRFPRKTKENLFEDLEPNEITHDPLDVFISLCYLEKYANIFRFKQKTKYVKLLRKNISDIFQKRIINYNTSNLYTQDELGIGFLLVSIVKLIKINKPEYEQIVNIVIQTAYDTLNKLIENYAGNIPDTLVFRKCGVSIGLGILKKFIEDSKDISNNIKNVKINKYNLRIFEKFFHYIEKFHQSFNQAYANKNWNEHGDINTIMYLVSKNPEFMC